MSKKLYMFSASASTVVDNHVEVRAIALAVDAINSDEATGKAWSRAKKEFPIAGGWSGHSMSDGVQIDMNWMAEIVAQRDDA